MPLTTFLLVLLATGVGAFGSTPQAIPDEIRPNTDPGTPCKNPADFMSSNTFSPPGGKGGGMQLTCGVAAAEGWGAGPGKKPMAEKTCANENDLMTINRLADKCCSGGVASSRCNRS
eukprot:CAMPEP_0119073596 /NCGR_PEP_ID=MMETSP1178-20130426/67155_1 /TAXON_ID=33656 /ORGANISM="unid sp, Strain CCMP2000" /LENGTH=116 /DNA_ID=CAMNT_0007055693 /DNA_START=57 /DNA_END=407 /DNA_ORIENTATION=+